MTAFLRLIPWIIALALGALSLLQWSSPYLYPWPLLLGVVLYLLAAVGLAWRARRWREGLARMLPVVFPLLGLVYGHLLVESWQRYTVTGLFVLVAFLSLELGFFFLYAPNRYPSQGFQRFAWVSSLIGLWSIVFTTAGLNVFLQYSRVVIGVLFAISAFAMWLSSRAPSEWASTRWLMFGGLFSLHVAALGLMLPISMQAQAAFSTLGLAVVLRFFALDKAERNWKSWFDLAFSVLGSVAILITARWL